ncbi:TraI domain-containing protein [Serratia microhaemolytica]|uniref:TraI domain-containing protein n=1 Tax=Serratia microhaemolytica TaxID=2675110 RepID=UPI000FDEBEED|nr:TraI domain-containing protein [Serratia microhaemolytica]
MLSKIKTLLLRTALRDTSLAPTHEGYYAPESVDSLLTSALRQDCLLKIKESSSLPSELYQSLYLMPITQLLEYVQHVPAAICGDWAYTGGFGDLTLRFTANAVRLSKGYMFPPGATPEDQASQGVMWQAVIFWAALFYHLPLLTHLEGEESTGNIWQPGITVPAGPYRFRFRPSSLAAKDISALAAVIANQLMPIAGIRWLAGNPAALSNLAGALWNSKPAMPLIRSLLQQSAERVASPLAMNQPATTIEPLVPSHEFDIVTLLPSTAQTVPNVAPIQPDVMPSQSEIAEDTPIPVMLPDEPTKLSPVPLEDYGDTEIVPVRSLGEQFLTWLIHGLSTGTISANEPASRVHFIAGFVYLLVPDIFYLFIKESGCQHKREKIQSAFEKLQLHRTRKGERFTPANLSQPDEKKMKFNKVNGYLIKVARLRGITVQADSQHLFFSQG